MLYRAVEFGSPNMKQIKERYLRYFQQGMVDKKTAVKKYAYDMATLLLRLNVKIILNRQFMQFN